MGIGKKKFRLRNSLIDYQDDWSKSVDFASFVQSVNIQAVIYSCVYLEISDK